MRVFGRKTKQKPINLLPAAISAEVEVARAARKKRDDVFIVIFLIGILF